MTLYLTMASQRLLSFHFISFYFKRAYFLGHFINEIFSFIYSPSFIFCRSVSYQFYSSPIYISFLHAIEFYASLLINFILQLFRGTLVIFFSRVHATLQATVSVGRSVGLLVCHTLLFLRL